MKNLILSLSAAALAVTLTGCFSVDSAGLKGGRTDFTSLASSRDGVPVRHLVVENYGWYLFNRWPIVCGNARSGASFPWAFFRDDVHETVLQTRLTAQAAALGCRATEVNMFADERVLFNVYGIPVPIPYVVCYHEKQISAVLMKPPTHEETARARARLLNGEMRDLLNRIPEEKRK